MSADRKFCVVTGAAGFIGSHLVDNLLDRGGRVLGLDNFVRGLSRHLDQASQNPNFTFQDVNIDCESEVADALEAMGGQPEMLWHFAANSDIAAGVENPDIDYRDTFLTTFTLTKICRKFGIRKVAFASTSAIYGDHGALPLHEDFGPLFPISNYGAMKLASEAVLTALSEGHLDQLWIFRFPNVIGPRATHGVIYDFLEKLSQTPGNLKVLGNGTQCKPYLYIDDLLDSMLFITESAMARINCYNIGPADLGVSVQEIAETVVAQAAPRASITFGSEARGWVGDVPKFRYSIRKLEKLGWTPQHSSLQAVQRAVGVQIKERAKVLL